MNKIFRTAAPLILATFFTTQVIAQGKVGINTTSPQAMLHVKDSSVLFTGAFDGSLPNPPGNPPVSGKGIRMMWYPDKAAFRAGYLTNSTRSNRWDKDSIGEFSVAVGRDTKAKGVGAFAGGIEATATGEYAFAFGLAANATGLTNVAIGNSADAYAHQTVAIGRNARAYNFGAIALGNNLAIGRESIALGEGNVARAYRSIALGISNDSIASSNTETFVATDPLFILGNGGDGRGRRNALIVAKNSETGINVANGMPQAMLHIKAAEISDNRHIRLEDDNTAASANIFYTSDLVFKNNLAGGDFIFRNDANANIFSLFSSGNVTMAGTLTQNSDARLKKNIAPLDKSLEKILQVGGYHYQWNEDYRDQALQTGLLAQQVETAMPELVTTSAEGTKSVNYSGMIPYLVEAMKELSAELELQKASNKKLQEEVERLKKKK
jgi:hypothetical protein